MVAAMAEVITAAAIMEENIIPHITRITTSIMASITTPSTTTTITTAGMAMAGVGPASVGDWAAMGWAAGASERRLG